MIEPDEHQDCKTAYLVRPKPDQSHPGEFVGIFVADNQRQLQRIVDECCDADACEYIIIPSGGVYQPGRCGTVPPEENGPDLFAGAAISDQWLSGFHSRDAEQRWTALALGAANDTSKLDYSLAQTVWRTRPRLNRQEPSGAWKPEPSSGSASLSDTKKGIRNLIIGEDCDRRSCMARCRTRIEGAVLRTLLSQSVGHAVLGVAPAR